LEARLRQAELARIEAQARAEEEAKRRTLSEQLAVEASNRAAEERRRRRTTLALAAAVLALVVLGGGGLAWNAQQRAARQARVDGLLGEVEAGRQRPDILAVPGVWEKTRVALGQAEELVAAGVDAFRGNRLRALKAWADQVDSTRALLAELEEIRGNRVEYWDPRRTDREYDAVFRRAGLDLSSSTPPEAGAWVAGRPQPVELAGYLDDWAAVCRKGGMPKASWRRLVETAQLADPDRWRNRLRGLMLTRPEEAAQKLRALANDANGLEGQPPESLALLALLLRQDFQDRVRAEHVLQRAHTRYPGDFWVNLELARAPGEDGEDERRLYPRPEDAVRYLSAAVAVRPRSAMAHIRLGGALRVRGKLAEADAACREAVRLRPDLAEAHTSLGIALRYQGKLAEAVAAFREAIHLRPDFASAHTNLGNALRYQGKLAEAVAACQEAIRLRPDFAVAHSNLGAALWAQGKLAEAVAACRKSIRLRPDYASAHGNLGDALRAQGKLAEAVAACREALRLRPNLAEAHYNLGVTLQAQGKLEEALATFRQAARLAPPASPLARALPGLIRQVERHLAVAARLDGVLKGDDKPADAAEGILFAQLCATRGLHAAAARLYAAAFAADARLAADSRAHHRYNAACSAALAGCGRSKDDPSPDEAARVRLRRQALDWLRADLAGWTEVLDKGPPGKRPLVQQTLRNWQQNRYLASVRDQGALAGLPEAERANWGKLWAEVDSLLQRAGKAG
jgi:tetratricopeptide (TPR) repeat protein